MAFDTYTNVGDIRQHIIDVVSNPNPPYGIYFVAFHARDDGQITPEVFLTGNILLRPFAEFLRDMARHYEETADKQERESKTQ